MRWIAVAVIWTSIVMVPSSLSAQTGFTFRLPDYVATYDPGGGSVGFTAAMIIEQDPSDPGYPSASQGMSASIAHDTGKLSIVDYAFLEPMASLNGGSGPDFASVSLRGTGVAFGCVWSFLGGSSILHDTALQMLSVDYEPVPSALGGLEPLETTLEWSEEVDPPLAIVIVVAGASYAPALDNADVLLMVGFRRADANVDGAVNIADAVTILSHLFSGVAIDCREAADVNGDGSVDLGDSIFLLGFLNGSGFAPPPPFTACGDHDGYLAIGCESYDACP